MVVFECSLLDKVGDKVGDKVCIHLELYRDKENCFLCRKFRWMVLQPDAPVYRLAVIEDLRALGALFLAAFPESVAHYVGHAIPPDLLADALAICLEAEPEAFYVAVAHGTPVGYIFAPAHFSRVVTTCLRRGYLVRMLLAWLSGRYQIGVCPVWIGLKNWLHFFRDARDASLGSDARIFSVAVAPSYQGKGVGNSLLQYGMAYLHKQRVTKVRLEVRPENGPALHLYAQAGFVVRGRTRDSQGDWLIMLKEME